MNVCCLTLCCSTQSKRLSVVPFSALFMAGTAAGVPCFRHRQRQYVPFHGFLTNLVQRCSIVNCSGTGMLPAVYQRWRPIQQRESAALLSASAI